MTNPLRRALGRHDTGPDPTPDREVRLDEEELRRRLDPQQYRVLREAATEAPFSGRYVHAHDDGSYCCAACGGELFSSAAKFDSGTGWPSFDRPGVAEHIELRDDDSLFMRRTEVLCRRCGSHLGHLFDDGPTATGQRYCINSCALTLRPADRGSDAVPEA